MASLADEILPTRSRALLGATMKQYPNTITSSTVLNEVKKRLLSGMLATDALITVAEGLRTWQEHEYRNYKGLGLRQKDNRR